MSKTCEQRYPKASASIPYDSICTPSMKLALATLYLKLAERVSNQMIRNLHQNQ